MTFEADNSTTTSLRDRPSSISDLYRLKLKQANQFRQLADDKSQSDELLIHLRTKITELESSATYLAHYIAMFGDEKISSFKSGTKKAEFVGLACGNFNPWARGSDLIVIESELLNQ